MKYDTTTGSTGNPDRTSAVLSRLNPGEIRQLLEIAALMLAGDVAKLEALRHSLPIESHVALDACIDCARLRAQGGAK